MVDMPSTLQSSQSHVRSGVLFIDVQYSFVSPSTRSMRWITALSFRSSPGGPTSVSRNARRIWSKERDWDEHPVQKKAALSSTAQEKRSSLLFRVVVLRFIQSG